MFLDLDFAISLSLPLKWHHKSKMMQKKNAPKNYFPFAFPVSFSLTNVTIREVKGADVAALMNEQCRDIIVFEHDDYKKISFKDFYDLSQMKDKHLMVSIAKLIIMINSCQYYYRKTRETPKEIMPSGIFNLAVFALFTIEEILPPQLDVKKQSKIGITAGQAKRIVFNANQLVFHMLSTSFVIPRHLDNDFTDNFLAKHHLALEKKDKNEKNMDTYRDGQEYINDLINPRRTRFILTYSMFYLKYLKNNVTEEKWRSININPFFPYSVLKTEKFEKKKMEL